MAEWSYPMEIYILRHGIAEEPAPGMKDADRALTSEGAAKLERCCGGRGRQASSRR
jgi:phosphohistidine phosphatase